MNNKRGEGREKPMAVRIKKPEEMGLQNKIQPFEDGMRVGAQRGNYEWWYFDSKYPDGSSLVIVFFSKPVTSMKGKLEPYVSLDYIGADGKEIHTELRSQDFHFSKDGCHVQIGDCWVKGDLKQYQIFFQNEKVRAQLELKATVPSWRPYSGHLFFNEKDYFAWLPSVPEGEITGTISFEGKEMVLEGTGYHDHNWGNKLMIFLMNDWYWGRAKVGEYVVVSAYIYANKNCRYAPTPVFMLAKNGKILCDDAYQYLKYREGDFVKDPYTGRYVAKTLIYEYTHPENHYRITYRKGNEEVDRKIMKDIVGPGMAGLCYWLGFRGSYHRMGGSCTVERLEDGEVVESHTQDAMWEQMCFGPDRVKL